MSIYARTISARVAADAGSSLVVGPLAVSVPANAPWCVEVWARWSPATAIAVTAGAREVVTATVDAAVGEPRIAVGVGQASLSAPAPLGEWHLLGVSFDGQRVSLYLDGLEADAAACVLDFADALTQVELRAGEFEGVRLWGRSLDQSTSLAQTLTVDDAASTLLVDVDFGEVPFIDRGPYAVPWSSSGDLSAAESYTALEIRSGGHVDAGADPATLFPGQTPFSIDCWIRPELSGRARSTVVARGTDTTGYSIAIEDGAGGAFLAVRREADALRAPLELDADGWAHVALVRDDVSESLLLYLNGALAAQVATDAANTASAEATLLIGTADDSGGSGDYTGSISDLRLWDRALRPDEVHSAMDRDLLAGPGLVAAYSFLVAPPADALGVQPPLVLIGDVHLREFSVTLPPDRPARTRRPQEMRREPQDVAALLAGLALTWTPIIPDFDARRLVQLDDVGHLRLDGGHLVMLGDDGSVIARGTDGTTDEIIWFVGLAFEVVNVVLSLFAVSIMKGANAFSYIARYIAQNAAIKAKLVGIMAAATAAAVLDFFATAWNTGFLTALFWEVLNLTWWGITMLIASIISFIVPWRWVVVAVLVAAALVSLIYYISTYPTEKEKKREDLLELTMCQAAHGDAFTLTFTSLDGDKEPKVTRFLVDGGPETSNFAANVEPNLPAHLSYAVVTHIDADHIGGILDMVTRMPPAAPPGTVTSLGQLWFNPVRQATLDAMFDADGDLRPAWAGAAEDPEVAHAILSVEQARQLKAAAESRQIEIRFKDDTSMGPDLGSYVMSFSGPVAQNRCKFNERADPGSVLTNRDSMIFTIRSTKNPAFTAWMTADAWDMLADDAPTLACSVPDGSTRTDIRGNVTPVTGKHVTILKVPHHGSATTTDENFFDNVTADHYLISANGLHGHPSKFALDWIVDSNMALRKTGWHIYCTNETDSLRELVKDPNRGPAAGGYQVWILADGHTGMTFSVRDGGNVIRPAAPVVRELKASTSPLTSTAL